MRIHLDTDIGGDPDDACALVMLAGWPGVELVGVTTVADPDGRRARYATRLLSMLGLDGVPVASGAGVSLTTGRRMGDLPDHERYWGDVQIGPPSRGGALKLLRENLSEGATVAAVGPATNLAALELEEPGSLAGGPVVMMGGWFGPLGEGLPAWGPERDWNVQCDTEAALVVARSARVMFVPLAVTLRAQLRRRDLPRLVAAGAVGRLLARQAEAFAEDQGRPALAAAHDGLADDLLNFHHDPLTCAVAVGWNGVGVREVAVKPVLRNGSLLFEQGSDGLDVRLVVDVDAEEFGEVWLRAVESAGG